MPVQVRTGPVVMVSGCLPSPANENALAGTSTMRWIEDLRDNRLYNISSDSRSAPEHFYVK